MATEYEVFETLVDVVPGIGTGLKVYFALVNFGRKDKIEYRVEELEKQVRALQVLVDDLILRINKLNC
jgi:tetrahydromethanopterin S-methyltransferase subunit B